MGAVRKQSARDAIFSSASPLTSRGFVGASQVSWTSGEHLAFWARGDGDEGNDDDESSELEGLSHHVHLWTIAEPLERSILRVYPTQRGADISGYIRFFNPRGVCVSECTIASRPGQLVQIPISSFLDECETDSGLRHAHAELVTTKQCSAELEMSSRTRSLFMPALHRIDDREPRALPIVLSGSYQHVFAIVNPNDIQCSVKCRLYVGSRTPEEVCLLPPRMTVLLSPEVLFGGVLRELGEFEELQAYLRISTRSSKALGIQMLEERTFGGGEKVYGVVA